MTAQLDDRAECEIAGDLADPDGTPITGATVTLIDAIAGEQIARTTSSGEGGFRFDTLGAGTYVLIVSAAGHRPLAVNVPATAGETAPLHLVMHGSAQVMGVVRTEGRHGTPIEGATVTMADSRGEVIGASITRSDGDYLLTEIDAGTYTIVASGEGLRPTAMTLTVPDGEVVRQDLELGGAVRLTGIARTEEGRVVPDARITVLDQGGQVVAVTRTDADGRYTVADLPGGDYTVVASGYPPVASQVSATEGEATHDVRLGYEQVLHELKGTHR